jgi:hypothetical protein
VGESDDGPKEIVETRAKPAGSGGKRRTKLAIEQAIRDIQDRLGKGEQRAAIVERYCNRAKKPIPRSTIDRYIAIATKRWMDESNAALPYIRERRMHELQRIARLAERASGPESVQVYRMLNLMIQVEGSAAPARVDTRVAVMHAAAPELDVSKMDDETLALYEELALRAERGGALQLPGKVIGDASLVEDKQGEDDE